MSKPIEELNDAELYVECADVVQHMLEQLLTTNRQLATLARNTEPSNVDAHVTPLLHFTMYSLMNALGDIINANDAYDEDRDGWTAKYFEEIRRRHDRFLSKANGNPNDRKIIA